MESKVPLRIEQAVDLILTIPAHRSSNNNHAQFGNLIIEEYFIKLREEYKSDKNAYMYLNNLFAAIGSSVRAFSVQRDIFQTKWNALGKVKNSSLERASRLDKYSPFNGNIGKIISAFISLGSSSIIVKSYDNFLHVLGQYVLWVPVAFVVAMFGFDFMLELYRNIIIKSAEKTLPKDLIELWQQENTSQYKKILISFIKNAIEIHNCYYPDELIFKDDISNMEEDNLDEYINDIIDKHMVF